MFALKVKSENAQKIIEKLKDEKKYDFSFRVIRNEGSVYIPVKSEVNGAFEMVLPKTNRVQSLREKFGIGSFDVIGNIIMVLISKKNQQYSDQTAIRICPAAPLLLPPDSFPCCKACLIA